MDFSPFVPQFSTLHKLFPGTATRCQHAPRPCSRRLISVKVIGALFVSLSCSAIYSAQNISEFDFHLFVCEVYLGIRLNIFVRTPYVGLWVAVYEIPKHRGESHLSTCSKSYPSYKWHHHDKKSFFLNTYNSV